MILDPFGYPVAAANPPTTGAKGCDECNRPSGHDKHWPVFTVQYHGTEVCAKCLTPIHWPRERQSA